MTLWSVNKNGHGEIDETILDFTAGEDYILDQKLIQYDIKVNKIHCLKLVEVGIISKEENEKINKVLDEISVKASSGDFLINKEQEDVHTAVEEYVTEKLGEIGKKMHTGKSRNDQVLADVLLYSKESLNEIKILVAKLKKKMQNFASDNQNIKMPGYTHMQKAMPYSVSSWILSFYEMLKDDGKALAYALDVIDVNHLGSGAGFGISLFDEQINQKYGKILEFSKSFQNALYCQNSRGKYESLVLFSLNQVMLTLNKLATDLMLFTTQEFGYFSLPDNYCTGSSIMPQKKNYDILELLRGKTHLFSSHLIKILTVYCNNISGYNRDMQLSKKILFDGIDEAISCIKIMIKIIQNLGINKDKLNEAMTEELLATEKTFDLVKNGTSFREAYFKVKNELGSTFSNS